MFFRAVVLLPAISLSLRLRGFRATQQSLRNFSVASIPGKYSGNDVANAECVEVAVRMVNAAARYGWGQPSCLQKSLALWWLLRQQGTASSVRIGAQKAGGKFQAHAWVERDAVALNEPLEAHRHYAAFDAAFPLQNSENS
jgi:hypothetical protein